MQLALLLVGQVRRVAGGVGQRGRVGDLVDDVDDLPRLGALPETAAVDVNTIPIDLIERIESGDRETQHQMRVLHEDLVERIKLLGEGLAGR